MVLEGLANANAHGARSAEVSVAIDNGASSGRTNAHESGNNLPASITISPR